MNIIDNFIEDQKLFKQMQDKLFASDVAWYYVNGVGYETDKSHFFFIHHLYEHGEYKSVLANTILMPIIYRLKIKSLLRARINCYTKTSKNIRTQLHTDSTEPHKVAIFSINTNNGSTYFEKDREVKSKENRMILFDGKQRHCAVIQTDTNLRMNININYI